MAWIQDSIRQVETAIGEANGKVDIKWILIAAGVIIAAYVIMKRRK